MGLSNVPDDAVRRLDWIWLMPEARDSNRHLRAMLRAEADACMSGLQVRFFTGGEYEALLLRKGQAEADIPPPDAALLFGSAMTTECDLHAVSHAVRRRAGCVLGAWWTDDPYELDVDYAMSGLVDHVFTNDAAARDYYHRDQNTHFLPLAAAEGVHGSPYPLPEAREWDFVFCGAAFANRVRIIEGLLPVLRRYRTLVVGNVEGDLAWPVSRLRGITVRPPLPYSETLALYRNSRIVLNLSRAHDLSNTLFEVVPSTPAPRTFEVAALGVCQFVFNDRPEILEHFAEDEVVLFDTQEEFAALAERYLGDPTQREAVAARARQRALSRHLYRHRLETLADILIPASGAGV